MDAELQALCDAKGVEMYKMQAEIERLRERIISGEETLQSVQSFSFAKTNEIERLRGLLRNAGVPEWVITGVREALGE